MVLVGHSSGCAIAIEATDRIEKLAGLVLWEAPIGQFTAGAPQWWKEVESNIERGDLEAAVAAYMVDMPPEWIEGLKHSPRLPGAHPQLGARRHRAGHHRISRAGGITA